MLKVQDSVQKVFHKPWKKLLEKNGDERNWMELAVIV